MQDNISFNYTINIILRLFFNLLSFLGSLFIIISYLKFRRLRKFAFKLICYLSLSDLIFSISTFLIYDDADEVNPHFCSFQAFALYYSSASTIIWTSCIAYSLQKVVQMRNRGIEQKERLLCLIGYGVPFILALIPLIMGYYGPSSFLTDTQNRWCGIKREVAKNGKLKPEGLILDWVVRFIPIIACFFFNGWMYVKVRRFFLNMEVRTDLMDIIKNKIKYFPLIPIFCWSIEILLRILELVYINSSDSDDVFNHQYIVWLDYFDSILEKSHGFINAMLYGFTQYVRYEWKTFFFKKPRILRKKGRKNRNALKESDLKEPLKNVNYVNDKEKNNESTGLSNIDNIAKVEKNENNNFL